jgi:hypothetical protein
MAAAARVHRCDQLKAGRISSMPLGAGDGHAAGLKRLPQRLEGSAVELRNYVAVSPKVAARHDGDGFLTLPRVQIGTHGH